jgi:hypothetical protein
MSVSERLVAVHRELDDLFVLHGESLLERELELARELFAAYRTLLFMHMEHEERVLLPRYAELGALPRFPLVLYTGQHEKIRSLADALERRTALIEGDRSGVRRSVLELFDRHATFKHLLEHHDGAERQGLFAQLDLAEREPFDDGADAWWERRRGFDALVERARKL